MSGPIQQPPPDDPLLRRPDDLTRSSPAAIVRISVEGRDELPAGPYVLCFSHADWVDPFVLMAVLPWRPRLYFFGPKEEDMTRGGRNRLMLVGGQRRPVPARQERPARGDAPGPGGLHRRRRPGDRGGGAHPRPRERRSSGSTKGAAYFALRAGVPVVPVADQRHDAGTASAAGSGSASGEPLETVGTSHPRGGRRADRTDPDGAPRPRRRFPRSPPPGPVRALADRAVQRLAGGRPPRLRGHIERAF